MSVVHDDLNHLVQGIDNVSSKTYLREPLRQALIKTIGHDEAEASRAVSELFVKGV